MSKFIINKLEKTYHFINYNENINFDNVISWLETYNPIYAKLEKSLLSKDYTGIIKIFDNNILHTEIKVFEGSFFRIKNFQDNVETYIEDNKLPLEIRFNNKINKINVKYFYDTYIIVSKTNDFYDIYYQDTMERDSFNLRSVKLTDMSEHQLTIKKKFKKIIKDTVEKINSYVDNIDF